MSKIDFGPSPPIHRACGNPVEAQYDTHDQEPFWHCWECEESFTISGEPAVYMTCIPESAVVAMEDDESCAD